MAISNKNSGKKPAIKSNKKSSNTKRSIVKVSKKSSQEKVAAEQNKRKNLFIIKISIFIIVLIGILISFFYRTPIEHYLNYIYNDEAPSSVLDMDGLVVHFIDVGQADAILIEFPGDKVMLVDAGQPLSEVLRPNNQYKDRLINYINNINLRAIGNEKVIDYFVITHPDFDHIASAPAVFAEFFIETCYRPFAKIETEVQALGASTYNKHLFASERYKDTINALNSEKNHLGTACKSFFPVGYDPILNPTNYTIFEEEDVKIEFLSPTVDDLTHAERRLKNNSDGNLADINNYNSGNPNNYSQIITLTYKNKTIMLTGDAEKEIELALLDRFENNLSTLKVDVLKLGHHGSNSSSTAAFLAATQPTYAVIMAGTDNLYGHPNSNVLSRLNEIGVNSNQIYRTDLNGNIVFGISSEGEIAAVCGFKQWTTFNIKWWYVSLVIGGVTFVILFVPEIAVAYIKKEIKKK